jgi:pimeloyl-ACP methyl ester carboxylesterase
MPIRSPLPAVLLAALAMAPMPTAAARTLGKLAFKPCDLAQQFQAKVFEAECAYLTVPENPDAPDGRKIALRIALVESTAAKPEPDAVFFLAGGPGQSALESYPSIAPAFRRVLEHRHVVLVDQRGTGGSHKMECKFDNRGETGAAEGGEQGVAERVDTPGRFAERLKQCLAGIDADPSHYTTEDAVRDLDQVRTALGLDKINLVGGSYGTRFAQHYLRRHPDHTRSVILDGVVPPELALGADHAVNLQAALDGIADRCSRQESCSKAFGDMRETLRQLRATVVQSPREYAIRDPQSALALTQRFDLEALVTVARIFAYAPETSALLPFSLNEALAGRPEVLLEQARLISAGLGEQITHGLEFSVICAEDADLIQDRPENADTLMGTEFPAMIHAGCALWPKGARAADFHEPLKSDVPVLLLSGEFDPVTPPRYGEQAKQGLSRSRHLVAKGQGHIVIQRGCMPRLVAEFIKGADPAKLDDSCLQQLGPTPAFVTANGWEP